MSSKIVSYALMGSWRSKEPRSARSCQVYSQTSLNSMKATVHELPLRRRSGCTSSVYAFTSASHVRPPQLAATGGGRIFRVTLVSDAYALGGRANTKRYGLMPRLILMSLCGGASGVHAYQPQADFATSSRIDGVLAAGRSGSNLTYRFSRHLRCRLLDSVDMLGWEAGRQAPLLGCRHRAIPRPEPASSRCFSQSTSPLLLRIFTNDTVPRYDYHP